MRLIEKISLKVWLQNNPRNKRKKQASFISFVILFFSQRGIDKIQAVSPAMMAIECPDLVGSRRAKNRKTEILARINTKFLYIFLSCNIKFNWLISRSMVVSKWPHCCSYSSRTWLNIDCNFISNNCRISCPCWVHILWICCEIYRQIKILL